MTTKTLPDAPCGDCGMICSPTEYHPHAACLMFKACHDGDAVRAELAAVRTAPAGFDIHLSQTAVAWLAAYCDRDPVSGAMWPGLRLQLGDGHSGWGLYLLLSDYPEEGAELLAAIPSPARRAEEGGA